MPFGVQVQILSRAPELHNSEFFRPQGDFLSPESFLKRLEQLLQRGALEEDGAAMVAGVGGGIG